RRHLHGLALAVDDATAATGASEGGQVSIAPGDDDIVHLHSQGLGSDLGEDRISARDIYRARQETHRAIFEEAARRSRRTTPTAPLTHRQANARAGLGRAGPAQVLLNCVHSLVQTIARNFSTLERQVSFVKSI